MKAELTALYQARGLSPELAADVARALTARDALAAHIEVEHRLALDDPPHAPIVIGTAAGLAYVLGALIPLLTVLLAPDELRAEAALVATVIALTLTSVALARMGVRSIRRSLLRTLAVAALAAGLSMLAGWLLDP